MSRSTPHVPKSMKALVLVEGSRIAVQDHPVPEVGDEDVLVRTVAVAQNPTDWKFLDWAKGNPGSVVGCDWSGQVVRVGENVRESAPQVGDHVAGFVMGSTFADSGAYAEYVRTPAELAWVVPEGTFTYEEAATLGCALWTAAQALYHLKRLGLVVPPAMVSGEEWVYIHGGASSVGQFAIQLAVLSGYKVVATASPQNFALLASLGASVVFDYRDPDVVSKVKAAAHDSVRLALDTISLQEAQEISAAVIAPTGGKVTHVLPVIASAMTGAEVVRETTLVYTALGRAYAFPASGHHIPAVPEDRAQIVEFLKKVPGLVKDSKIKPLPIRLWEGGLNSIPAGLQYMKEGKVSAEKIVYRI